MTVQDLINQLSEFSSNAEIKIGIDEELRQYCLYIEEKIIPFKDEDVYGPESTT